MPILLYPFPSAIVHLDADSFFASVEQAVNPCLKGRPLVTGKERGIIACASYEAKARGIKRGIMLHDAMKMCPDLVVLPSDYETYSLYSKRMFNIMRRFTPMVEESSVDEACADISGMRRVFHDSYENIAYSMKEAVKAELDITVSIGLSVTRILAKMASKHNKPDGLTVVPGTEIHRFLAPVPVGEVCGIGPNAVNLLAKHGVRTAAEFVLCARAQIGKLLGKPGREIWDELRGQPVHPVVAEEKSSLASISKTKTFSAPSNSMEFVYARLVRNVESAFIKLRRHRLRTSRVGILLRRDDYYEEGLEARLNRPTSSTLEAMPLLRLLFDKAYRSGTRYRSVMVYLGMLTEDGADQLELFENRLRIDSMERASAAMDEVNERYGKHAVSIGSSLFLKLAPRNNRDSLPERRHSLLRGETSRQRIGLPLLRVRV